MIKGCTPNGFKFELDEKKLDDMRTVEILSKVGEHSELLPKAVNMILGEEQKEALYKFLETEDGRVPIGAFNEEFLAIMNSAKDGKKS